MYRHIYIYIYIYIHVYVYVYIYIHTYGKHVRSRASLKSKRLALRFSKSEGEFVPSARAGRALLVEQLLPRKLNDRGAILPNVRR